LSNCLGHVADGEHRPCSTLEQSSGNHCILNLSNYVLRLKIGLFVIGLYPRPRIIPNIDGLTVTSELKVASLTLLRTPYSIDISTKYCHNVCMKILRTWQTLCQRSIDRGTVQCFSSIVPYWTQAPEITPFGELALHKKVYQSCTYSSVKFTLTAQQYLQMSTTSSCVLVYIVLRRTVLTDSWKGLPSKP
jgi:hypothetical protein